MAIKPVSGEIKSQDINDNLSYLDSKTNNISKGAPAGTYETVSLLTTAHPNGNTNIYVVSTTGNWHYWNGSVWAIGGKYQETGIGENQVSENELEKNVISVSFIESSNVPNYDTKSKRLDFRVESTSVRPIISYGNSRYPLEVGTIVTNDVNVINSAIRLIFNTDLFQFKFVHWNTQLNKNELVIGNMRYDGSKVNMPFLMTVDNVIPLPGKTAEDVNINNRIDKLSLDDIVTFVEFDSQKLIFEQGTISNTGYNEDRNNRIRTTLPVKVVANTKVSITSNYMFSVAFYTIDGKHISTDVWSQTNTIVFKEDCFVRFLVRKADDTLLSPLNFPSKEITGGYNGFGNIADKSIPVSKIDGSVNVIDLNLEYMHLSVDDVINIFKDITTNNYASIFDNPVLSYFKTLNDNFGAVFSMYCFYKNEDDSFDLSMMSNKYRQEFIDNSHWIKWGVHYYKNGTDNFGNIETQQAVDYYNLIITELHRICGAHALDYMPRLHNYAGSTDFIERVSQINLGIKGLITAEDNRQNYHLNTKQNNYMQTHDSLYDADNYLKFASTDLRLENISDVKIALADRLSDIEYASRCNSLILFTHENQLVNESMLDKIKHACEFSVANNYRFDYPLNN